MRQEHPAVKVVREDPEQAPYTDDDRGRISLDMTTSVSLAHALCVGLLSQLDPQLKQINVWDPAAGTGFAGLMLVKALEATGTSVRYRGQDIHENAVEAARARFGTAHDAELACGDVLAADAFEAFEADLVLVDPPFATGWAHVQSTVEARRAAGEYRFELPQKNDSTWLFISLALEKLRPAEQGGGRVAALVAPRLLSEGGPGGKVRQSIVEAGLLESVTRLPEGLTPSTNIPLYLLTFTNKHGRSGNTRVRIADLQTQYTTHRRYRSLTVETLGELERGLRTGKQGPRNRTVEVHQLLRRDARIRRTTVDGAELSWGLQTHNNTPADDRFLDARYGSGSGVAVEGQPRQTFDLNPSPFFEKDSRELSRSILSKGWEVRRLSTLIRRAPEAVDGSSGDGDEGTVFVPTSRTGKVSLDLMGTESDGRILAVQVDEDLIDPGFLASWLNSEPGVASRQLAATAGASGTFIKAVRSDAPSLLRWADELMVPLPPRETQIALARADEQLESFEAELNRRRDSIRDAPDTAEDVVNRIAGAFDDSLDGWIDQLPFPIATALWTAEIAGSPSEQQRAYLHAWEAIVTFHATVLLAASRSDPGSSAETEEAIRATLKEHHMGLQHASFGTWVVIIERTAKDLRRALESGDADEEARVRRAFAGLGRSGIERLVSKDIVRKFNEVSTKRNSWLGHSGYIPDDGYRDQIESLFAALRELRQLLGDVWSQLLLVRAGHAKHRRDGVMQTAEVAVGRLSPFRRHEFKVGDAMHDGELYLVRDGAETPLRVGPFVQLRSAPQNAQFMTYFYNRIEGDNVRLVSYQYGSSSEIHDDIATFVDDFGNLASS